MQKTDLRTIALAILKPKVPGASRQRLTDFFKSAEFQKNVLPLLQDIENHLMDQWRGFTTPDMAPMAMQDFGTSAFNSTAVSHSASMRGSDSKAIVTGGNEAENRVSPPTQAQAMSSTLIGIAMPTQKPEAIVEVARPNRHRAIIETAKPTPTPAPAAASASALTPPSMVVEFQFPNASVGQPYLAELNPTQVLPSFVVEQVQMVDIGLRHDRDGNRICGTPTRDGEFAIEIAYSCGGAGLEVAKTRLIVNPDPKSLWKNLPSDENDPYWKPDEDAQLIAGSEGFVLVGGSKRGRSHAQKGTFRDDDFFIYSQVDAGWQIAVVSDGAGGSKFSRRGSAIICKEGGEHLEHALAGEAGEKLTAAVEAWHAAQPGSDDDTPLRVLKTQLYVTLGYAAHHSMIRINEECQRRADLGGTVKDYSSTALFGVVKRFPFGVFCASFSVGDGAIAVIHDDGTPELLCTPDGGEYSGQTRFLSKDTVTQEELLKRLHFNLAPDFRGLYLMTDGVSDPYFQTDVGLTMPERWAKLIVDIEEAASLSRRDEGSARRLVTWLDFWSKGEHDDRTLVAIF